MAQLSPETVWNASETEFLRLLNKGIFSSETQTRKIRFYAPSFMYYKTSHYSSSPNHFPTISVTGNGCALNCKHCGGKVLETMHPATTPQKLFDLCIKLKQDGALGCLISGGCLPNGTVPLQQYIPSIKRVKKELGLTVLVHTGIIDYVTAKALKDARVDAALIDIIGSNETIKTVYNLDMTVKDYEKSLDALHNARLSFVPHVIVGLQNGRLNGEFEALRMIAPYSPSALVIIAFMPIRGTAMAQVKPSQPTNIAKVVATARLMFPRLPLVLGCMRPKGKHRTETDVLALKAGVDAIAFPSEEAIAFAEKQGYSGSFSSFCCAQIYKDITTNVK